MIGKPSSLAFSGMALLCTLFLIACSDSTPVVRFVTVTPSSGTVFFSATTVGGVKGARSTHGAAVSPRDITTASCGSLQFAATAFYSNNVMKDVTSAAGTTWASSNSSVASVSTTGLASGFGLGTSTISAKFNGVSTSGASLEVDELNSITMNPPSANIPANGTQTFQALGNFTLASGSTTQQDLSSGFGTVWASDNTNVATVDNAGNITVMGSGTANITATNCGTVGKAMLTVGPPPSPLVITPGTATIAAGTTIQFQALTHADTTPVTGAITWQSSTPAVATMDGGNFGIALGVAASTTPVTITATESGTGATGTATLTVSAASARYAYVGDLPGVSITSYTVSGGALTHLADTPAASGAQQVLLHPSGDLLYYIDGGQSLQSYKLASTTGVLSPSLPPAIDSCTPATTGDISVGVIEPYGRFAYVISFNGNCIFGFAIKQSTGTLTPIVTSTINMGAPNGYTDPTLKFPTWVGTDRAGKYLYVFNSANGAAQGTISQYTIDQTTGAITPMSTPTINVGNGTTSFPQFGTTDVNGHLFAANLGNTSTDPQSIMAFNITSNGQLSLIGDTSLDSFGVTALVNVLTDPTAHFIYALDDNASGGAGQVLAFNLNSSGVIGTQVGTTQTTGTASTGMAIDPTGTLLLIDNALSNTISMFTVTSGAPGAPTTVATGSGPAFVTFYVANSGQ